MKREVAYSPEDVSKALMRLAANHGDAARTAGELIDDRFQVPADTLLTWKLETHSEQYRRIESSIANDLEEQAISQLRQTIRRVGELEGDMLERVGQINDPRLTPNALRALADTRAKATNELLQLTGRPLNGERAGGDVGQLVRGMVEAGLLRLAPGITLEQPAIEGTASEPAGG
jgi:hypothetical protein